MGRIEKTVLVILIVIILLVLASVGYICFRMFGKRRKREETEIDEDDEIDPDLLALKKTLVEKTPLAVENREHFKEETDNSLVICKRSKCLILSSNLCKLIRIFYLGVYQYFLLVIIFSRAYY